MCRCYSQFRVPEYGTRSVSIHLFGVLHFLAPSAPHPVMSIGKNTMYTCAYSSLTYTEQWWRWPKLLFGFSVAWFLLELVWGFSERMFSFLYFVRFYLPTVYHFVHYCTQFIWVTYIILLGPVKPIEKLMILGIGTTLCKKYFKTYS